MNRIEQNIAAVRKNIAKCAAANHRPAEDIRLLAVSKTKPASEIRQAWNAGQKDFGENYLQEAVPKIQTLSELEITWHYIGAIQSNKTRAIAENFDWVHTLTSEKHAVRLDTQRGNHMKPLNVCIQLNLSQEPTKNGIYPTDLKGLVNAIRDLDNLKLRGLMTMPDPGSPRATQKAIFEQLCGLKDADMDTLSMGMSNDMELAIAAGSTMVRIGTAIFGERL